jgi:hypothetical protein
MPLLRAAAVAAQLTAEAWVIFLHSAAVTLARSMPTLTVATTASGDNLLGDSWWLLAH